MSDEFKNSIGNDFQNDLRFIRQKQKNLWFYLIKLKCTYVCIWSLVSGDFISSQNLRCHIQIYVVVSFFHICCWQVTETLNQRPLHQWRRQSKNEEPQGLPLFVEEWLLSDGVKGSVAQKTAAEGHTLFTGLKNSAGILDYCWHPVNHSLPLPLKLFTSLCLSSLLNVFTVLIYIKDEMDAVFFLFFLTGVFWT